MPRNVKESDDEFETKGGRRTRTTLSSSVLDSPLRRSSRIKQPVNQDGSSPESNGDTSSTGTTRSTRRRTVAADSTVSELPKTLRTRRNSAVSDVSEMTEPESDSGSKRITRRSLASATFVDTPSKLRARPRREIRAGSESISTPPVGRVTRRTRASSMEPETTDEKKLQEIGTPVKSRRRASVLPSEPAVVEESNTDKSINVHHKIEQIVYEIDEDEPAIAKNTSESVRRKSKGDTDDGKMEIDENPVVESKTETMEVSFQENTATTADISQKKLDDSGQNGDSSINKDLIDTTDENQSITSPAKGSSYTIDNLLNKSSESQEKSPGNKENEILNTSGGLMERNFNTDVRTNRKSLNSSFAKSSETRYNIPVESDQPSNDKIQKIIVKDSIDIMAKKVDVDCVVVIEPMMMNKHDQIAPVKTSNTPELSKIRQNQQTPKVNKEETYPLNVANNEIVEKNEATKEGVTLKISYIGIPEKGAIESEKINDIEDPPKTTNTEKRGKIVLRRSCSEDTRNNEFAKKRSSTSAETIIRRFSMDSGESKKSKENIEPLTSDIAKNRISSIVTESSGTKVLEVAKVIDDCNDGSLSNGLLSKDEQRRKSDRIAEKLSNNDKNVSELVVFDSDNDSEIVSCKSFKDIPADEWTGNEESKEDNDEDVYSLNLSPVDCNDSESDLLLTSKEFSHGTKNKDSKEEKTVTNADKEEEMVNEEMEVSNTETEDQEDDDENKRMPKKSPKQTSLNKSRNSQSDFKMIDTPGKNSSPNLNVSRRKSTSEAANKSISTLDTSKDKISTPSNKKVKDTPDKRKSLDKSAVNAKTCESDETDFESRELDEWVDNMKKKMSENTEDGKSPDNKNSSHSVHTNSDDSADDDSPESPESPDEMQEQMEKSVTDRKSLNNSKIDQSVLHSDSADDDSPKRLESPDESLDRSTKSRNGRKSSIGMNRSKIEQSNLDSAEKSLTDRKSLNNSKIDKSVSNTDIDEAADSQLNKSAKSQRSRKSSIGMNRSKIDSSDSEIEENENSQFKKSATPRKSVNTSKIVQSDTDIEESADSPSKLNQSTKSRSGRKSSISMNRSKIDQPSSDSETDVNEDAQKSFKKSMTPRKSLNISKIGQSPSDSEIKVATDSPSKLNQSAKSQSGRKSSIGMNRSRIPQCNPDSETEENEDAQEQFEKSMVSRKSLNNSKIGQSDSKMEEAASPSKLNQSAKSRSTRKSSISMNRSKIQQSSSDSETEDNEDSQEQFQKSVTPRKSLNNSKIEQSSSDTNIEEEAHSPSKLNQSAKSKSGRKLSISMNRSKIQQSSSDSETEENEEQCKKSASGRKSLNSKLVESPSDSPSKLNRSVKSQSGRKSSTNMNQSKIERSIVDSESEENEDLREKLKKLDKSGSARKSIINDNYSIIAMANSDSDANDNFESNSSESDADVSRKIPRFMFASNSGDSDSDDSENENSASIHSDIARDMNLDGKSIIEYSDDNVPADDCMASETESSDSDDDGDDLMDFVVDDDDEESEEEEESMENVVAEQKHKKEKLRKRIIPKVMNSSSAESEDVETGPEISASSNDPSKDDTKLNESLKISQLDSPSIGLKSAQLSAKKNKNLLIQSSTPKILSVERSPLEKSKKSPKIALATKLETEGSAKKLSKSMLNTSETPKSGKLGSNLEERKSPKITQKSPNRVVEDTNVSQNKTSSSKKKSKVSSLHQTMTTPNTETAETRFLMKEKLNDSLPALKLQQKNESMRRSVLDNLRTENKIEENSHEEEEPFEIATEINAVKKNKKKKKKKKNIDTAVLDTETEINSPEKVNKDSSKLDASKESLTDKSLKKSKKRKNKKNLKMANEESIATEIVSPTKSIEDSSKIDSSQESLGIEEPRKKSKKRKSKKNLEIVKEESSVTEIEEVPKKNKKRKHERIEESIENSEESKRKKKKKQKTDKLVEPEVTTKKQTGHHKTAVVLEESTDKSGQETRRKKKVDKNVEKTKTSVKRLPDDIIESLPEVADRPKKRRKIVKEEKMAPSKRMFSPQSKVSTNIDVEEEFISLSSSGSTTQFGVVNMKKTMKKSHKSDTVKTFRERMLARNAREPISAYLVYQQKQKASGRDRIN